MFSINSSQSIPPKIEFRSQLDLLSLDDLETLHSWLETAIKERKAQEALKKLSLKKGREVLETRKAGKITYQLEKVRCGKKKCKCNQGKLHGPYWYAYRWNGKRLTSEYIGKELKELKEG